MATPAQIDEQIAFERDAIRKGIEKLHRQTKKLAEREYSSASVTACASISAAQQLITDAVFVFWKEIYLMQEKENELQ